MAKDKLAEKEEFLTAVLTNDYAKIHKMAGANEDLADTTVPSKDGKGEITLINLICGRKDITVKTVQALAEIGVDLTAVGPDGKTTALHASIMRQRSDIAVAILKYQPAILSKSGLSAIDVQKQMKEFVNAEDSIGATALDWACELHDETPKAELLKHGAERRTTTKKAGDDGTPKKSVSEEGKRESERSSAPASGYVAKVDPRTAAAVPAACHAAKVEPRAAAVAGAGRAVASHVERAAERQKGGGSPGRAA